MDAAQSDRAERIDRGVGSHGAKDNAPICLERKIATATVRNKKKIRRPNSLIVRIICGHAHSPRHSGTATGRADDVHPAAASRAHLRQRSLALSPVSQPRAALLRLDVPLLPTAPVMYVRLYVQTRFPPYNRLWREAACEHGPRVRPV